MTRKRDPLDFLWFVPSAGDNRYLSHPETDRAPTPNYLRDVAMAADRLGYYGVLMPTGAHCAGMDDRADNITPAIASTRASCSTPGISVALRSATRN